ncbi:MAG: oxidoreductase, partial [Gemmatimonadota bacterium]
MGGDYQLRAEPHPTVLATSDGGRTWALREGRTPLAGVRYGVTAGAWNGAFAWLTVGPSGTMYSPDG